MNYSFSYSGTNIAAGISKLNFRDGTITFPDGSTSTFTGSMSPVQGLNIYSSVQATVTLEGDATSVIIIPAGKYIRLRHVTEEMKVYCSSTYNLWFTASTETPVEVT